MPSTANETLAVGAQEADNKSSAPARRPRRNDIQGIRALCMIQVLLYHAWHVGSPIGVDSFIMISAYLMTGSFLRRSEAGRMPIFAERWVNTFKRLLPPLVFVVLVTLWAAIRLLPERMSGEMVTQAFASLGYWENWRLVYNAADYYAMDQSSMSPFQHLWSMSMQGQVFVVWPLLMTVAVGIRKVLRKKVSLRVIAVVIFGAVTAWSLSWLLTAGSVDAAAAYFDTRSRVWEFALGSAIAAAEPMLRRIPKVAPFLTWIGLATLVTYCLVEIGTYPGPMAAVPMLAVAMILVYGDQSPWTPQKLLSWEPLVWLGNLSYCVYLVHWPMFVFFLAAVGRPQMSVMDGIVMIVLSIVVAFALTRLLDDPVRLWPWANKSAWRKALICLVCLAVGNGMVFVVKDNVDRKIAAAMAADAVDAVTEHPGARVFQAGVVPPLEGYTRDPIPSGIQLESEWAEFGNPCPDDVRGIFSEDLTDMGCADDVPDLKTDPEIVLLGDSHMQQWVPAIKEFASRHDLHARNLTAPGCRFREPGGEVNAHCALYSEGVWDYLEKHEPKYVFLTSTRTGVDNADEIVDPGLTEVVRRLRAKGITVVGIRDNIRSGRNMYDCSAEAYENHNPAGCQFPEDEHFAPVNPVEGLLPLAGFHSIDLTDLFCRDGVCPGVIGNIYVYLDDNHITKSYVESLAEAFAERVDEALGLDRPSKSADGDDKGAQSGAVPGRTSREDGTQSGDSPASGGRSPEGPSEQTAESVEDTESIWEPEY